MRSLLLLAVPVLCCLGLTLLIAAGVAAWVGGLTVGALALAVALVVLSLHVRRAK